MTHYTGSIAAVPTANKQKYLEHVMQAWPHFRGYGARRMVDGWGVDIPKGKINDLYGAVEAREDETIVFSWIEWPDQSTAASAVTHMQADAAAGKIPPLPFDGSRMIFGGFAPIFTDGVDHDANFIQGFALAVPTKNKSAYVAMAKDAWETAFKPHGCLSIVEA